MARVLLGITGSVAAVKTPVLTAALLAAGHEVRVATTGAALAFFDPAELPASASLELPPLGERVLFRDEDEWPQDRRFQVGEPVLHIELRRWAELLVIAPLDANTLAKLALGLCDNLLTCIYRAWEPDRPILLAPAMNTRMWEHPATARHLRRLLEDFGGALPAGPLDADALCETINATCPLLRIAPPQIKRLACGDEGQGAMAEVAQIAQMAMGLLQEHSALG
jgi:phosphopantothenoylcysteine decarboxylase